MGRNDRGIYGRDCCDYLRIEAFLMKGSMDWEIFMLIINLNGM
jgi:hypothetical protein